MAKLNAIVRYLNKELKIKDFNDYSKNGLQINAEPKEVKRIGFAVDGCISTFEKAKKLGCDLVIVHHGIKWKYSANHKLNFELSKQRQKWAKKNKLSVYGCHLPLDAHEKYGNNAQLVELVGAEKTKRFGIYNGQPVGYAGKFKKPTTIKAIADRLNRGINTKCIVFSNGKSKIKTIAFVSGGGYDEFREAIKKEMDCFVTGECNQEGAVNSRDLKQNVIIAGHYATETVGVKALMKLLKEKFNIETVFIDNPTGF